MKLVYAKVLPIRLYGSGQFTGGVIAAAAIGAAGAIGSAVISSQGSSSNQQAVQNTQYQPIDINALQSQAQQFAQSNAANSIAIEQQTQAGLSNARFGLANTVAQQLGQGGNLSPDVYNQTANAAISGANSAGLLGAAGPITAASLGNTAQALQQQRIINAQNLVSANPLPTGGIDPGSLASAVIGQSNAQNQFDLSKLGATTAANQSSANSNAGLVGAIGGAASNALNAYNGSQPAPGQTYFGNTPSNNVATTQNYAANAGSGNTTVGLSNNFLG
jgi:hypothetical protein